MPYIGKNPVGGGFHKLDNLTASATATYALTLGSAAYYPESANQLLVSLNGVIQAPQDSFTVSGSNLVFDSALTASDSIDFVVALGDVLAVKTVTDGAITANKIGADAVTTAKIQDGAVTAAKIDSLPTGSVLQVVQVTKTDTQTITSNAVEKEISDLAASITPVSASSKILVTVHLSYSSQHTTYKMYFKRGGTIVSTAIGDSRGSRQNATIPLPYTVDNNQATVGSFSFLDSPASASQVDYTFFVINDNALSIFINRSENDQNNNVGGNFISMVTLTEIAG